MPVDTSLARVIGHPLRHRLIHEYTVATSSPSRVATALGESVRVVSYHTGVLRRAGCVELVRTARRRGATEHFYRATVPRGIEDAEWAMLPEALRRALVRRTLEQVWLDATDALPLGGMDGPASHTSRLPLDLDAAGEAELAALLRATVDRALQIAAESRERADGPVRPWTLAILGFSSTP